MKKHILAFVLVLALALLLPALAGCGSEAAPPPSVPGETDADSPGAGSGHIDPGTEAITEIRPDTIRPDTIRPDENQPDAIQTDAIQTDTIRPDTIRPDAPPVTEEYFPSVNTEKSASLLDELPKLGIEADDPRMQYIRAFVTADADLLEEACGVEKGMYAPYRTLDLAAWFAWIDPDAERELKFAFYPVHTDVEAFQVNAWNEGVVYEGPLGAYLYRPEPASSFGEASEAVSGLLTGYMPPILPTTDDMDESTRFSLTCYIYHKLGADYNGVEENYKLYAKTHFGIDDFTPEEGHVGFGCAHGGSFQLLDIIGSEEKNGETAVTVQFYADPSRTVKSHVCEYTVKKADGDWIFTGCRELLHAKYDAMRMVW